MSSNDKLTFEGEVVQLVRGNLFKVKIKLLEGSEKEILCKTSGKILLNNIKILPGDRVTIEMSPYDLEKGTIKYRYK